MYPNAWVAACRIFSAAGEPSTSQSAIRQQVYACIAAPAVSAQLAEPLQLALDGPLIKHCLHPPGSSCRGVPRQPAVQPSAGASGGAAPDPAGWFTRKVWAAALSSSAQQPCLADPTACRPPVLWCHPDPARRLTQPGAPQARAACSRATCRRCWRTCRTWPSSSRPTRACAACTAACGGGASPAPRRALQAPCLRSVQGRGVTCTRHARQRAALPTMAWRPAVRAASQRVLQSGLHTAGGSAHCTGCVPAALLQPE